MEEQNTSEVQPASPAGGPEVQLSSTPSAPEATRATQFLSFMVKNFLAVSILTAGVMISGSLLYTNGVGAKLGARINPGQQVQQPGDGTKVNVSADDDPVLGNKNAKVTIIEFSDFQCPFCRTFWRDTLGQIKKEYIDTGKVKFIYRDYPLSFHPMAHASAEAAECADDQGKYWEMHDKIFGEQEKLGQGTVTYVVSDLKKWAAAIGLDPAKFNQCLDSGKYKAEVDKDFADGSAAGVSGTPSLFINGRLLVGAQPYASFKAIIDEELNKK
ncbi:MAG: DsbA family protein [Candidatus Taylorbacteria bacterium]|nr:DsbA family protein [Candidatus Taylorbacteria bacterium]